MTLLLYFIIALILSFLGSLPIGLITLSIIQKTLQNGMQSGLMIALGATIMELVYTYIALISLDLFTQYTAIGSAIKAVAIFVFFSLGLYFLIKKSNNLLNLRTAYSYFDFLRGVVIGMMNMLIIPFWIFLGIWLESYNMLFEDQVHIIIFSLGAALGALLAFLIYIWFSNFITMKVGMVNQYTNKIVGTLFIGLGLFQVYSLLGS